MARGRLQLTSRQQPYCQVNCGVYSCRSKTAKDGGQNPTWNETLFFQVNNEAGVNVTVYAEHQISQDAVLGTAIVPIISVRQTGSEELSVPVMRKGREAGVLHVTVEFKGPAITALGAVGQALPARLPPPSVAGHSFTYRQGSVSSSSSQDGSVRLATMPIRLLQQPTSPLMASQHHQQHQHQPPVQQQQQQPAHQGPQVPQGSDPTAAAAAATVEARGLVLQRQLSPTVSGPLDVTALQQMYSHHHQQLQLVQAQLLRTLPPEQRKVQQQQMLEQLPGGVPQQTSGQQQQQQQQQPGSSGDQDADAAAAGRRGQVQLPKQPRKTAADLFKPDAAASGLASSLQHLLDDREADEDDQGGAGLSAHDLLSSLSAGDTAPGFDRNRLQAIIAKVYPDPSSSSSSAAFAQRWTAVHGPPVTAPSAAAVAPTVQPSSIGAFGNAAAAAALAAGLAYEVGGSSSSSIGLGGFGGAAGMAAAAAAAAAALDPGPDAGKPHFPAISAGTSCSGSEQILPHSSLNTTVGSQTPSARSAAGTPITLPYSSPGTRSADLAVALSSVTASDSLSNHPSAGAAVEAQMPVSWNMPSSAQQDQLPPGLNAVLADELARMKAAAPLLAQLLGLAPAGTTAASSAVNPVIGGDGITGETVSSGPLVDSAAAPSTAGSINTGTDKALAVPRAAAGPPASSECNSRVTELEGMLSAAYQGQAQLAWQLQERDCQLQLLLQQYTDCQHELTTLRAKLAQFK